MHCSFITLFPDIFPPVLDSSIIGKAQKNGIVTIEYTNIRDFAIDSYGSVDDHPYGGGEGMILRVDVVHRAIEETKKRHASTRLHIIATDPRGKIFTQDDARRIAGFSDIAFLAGHYEGFDERIYSFVDESLSIGEYVLTGGELPSMVMADAAIRLLPGVLATAESSLHESFSFEDNQLEYPHYTKPQDYLDMKVPDILLSGNHKKINEWRMKQLRSRNTKHT